jgi:hypothetical protein
MEDSITYTRQDLNDLLEEYNLELSLCDTENEKRYYRGIIRTYESMLAVMSGSVIG